jgi:acetolactate synthase-1/2/3 large subunit
MRTLADGGVKHVFLLTGGGAMFLNDAIGQEKRIQYVCQHHEQACAMAAEAYARISGNLGVINVTTGPGAINALNGVFGAWTDSIPMLILSGQVKRQTCMSSYPELAHYRQLGDQEVAITKLVKDITKYAAFVDDPQTIGYHLARAVHLATSGRPGPCWLDIPVDVQSAKIDAGNLPQYDPNEDEVAVDSGLLATQCRELSQRLQSAQRPVLMVGSGVRIARAEAGFQELIERLRIPVVTTWTAIDLLPSDHPLYCGRPGMVGDRAGNFTVQNSDLLIMVGCRPSIRQVSYNWTSLAREAFRVRVDADPEELKNPFLKPEMGICADAGKFFRELSLEIARPGAAKPADHAKWLAWCKERVARYPVSAEPRERGQQINPYDFCDVLFQQLKEDDVVACANGAASVIPFQIGRIKAGQRVFTNAGAASMGYELPAAIGAAFARPGSRVICMAGDGSFQLNLQELQTVVHHGLNIKIIVLNNNGYLSIRNTQLNFFGAANLVGEGPASGVSFPDMIKIGQAYGLPAIRIEKLDFAGQLEQVLQTPGPVLCEVVVDPKQTVSPRLSSRVLPDGRIVSSPLEDMFPFLEREEFRGNMLVKVQEND